MKKDRPAAPSFLRGITVQLFFITILPLTLLSLVIAFGSVLLHQRDMRSLVGERDERADLMGARLEVQSEAGKGTRLSVRLPIPSNKSQRK